MQPYVNPYFEMHMCPYDRLEGCILCNGVNSEEGHLMGVFGGVMIAWNWYLFLYVPFL